MGSHAEALADRIAEQAAHLDAATHRLLTDLREFDESGEWYKQAAQSCAHWLSWRVGWDLKTAKQHLRVANKLGGLPLTDEALRLGKISYAKVRAITRVATLANEATLLEYAEYSTAAQLETICRKYRSVLRGEQAANEQDDRVKRFVWRRDLDNGMVQVSVTLHPEEAALLYEAMNKIAVERKRERSAEAADCATCVDGDRAVTALAGAMRGDGDTADTAAAAVTHWDGESATALAACATRNNGESTPARPASAARTNDDESGRTHKGANNAPAGAPVSWKEVPREFLGTQERTTTFSRVDALVTMAQEILRGTRPHRSPTELIVTVGADVLFHPTQADHPIGCTLDGTAVSAETIRRLSCDAGIVFAREDDKGNTVSIGRKSRAIPAGTKRAMLKRDKTCRFPGCQNRMFLDGHHAVHWADGGETSLANLVGLCGFHHRFLHEYGLNVVMDENQHPTFFDPSGRAIPEVHPTPELPSLGWTAILEQNEELAITSDSQKCRWDGGAIQYDDVVGNLLRTDPPSGILAWALDELAENERSVEERRRVSAETSLIEH